MVVSLQYLRAVAAIMVVAFHAGETLAHMGPGPSGLSFTVGLAGVDVFFVISGFIITVTSSRNGTTPSEFMLKRFIRIVPLYWLLTGLIALVALIMPQMLGSTVLDARHFAASLLFLPWQHPVIDARLPLLIPGWTLNYEMMFYTLFAAALFLPKSWRLPSMLAVLFWLALIGRLVNPESIAGFYMHPIILEFAAGMVIAELWTRGVAVPRGLAFAAITAGFVLLWLGTGSTLPRLIGSGLPAAMIVAGAVFAETRRDKRGFRLPLLLGDASYSIYLSHVIVLPVLAKGWVLAKLPQRDAYGLAFEVVTLAVCIAAGVLLYKLVEKPLLSWLSAANRRTVGNVPVSPAPVMARGK